MDSTQKILKVADVRKILRIGRDRAYALMRADDFPSIKIGQTYIVTAENFDRWLDQAVHSEICL